jgi:peptide/nickel transport system substrate-binding protein
MEALDPLGLRVTLKRPHPHWDMVVARSLSTIGSPAALADAGEAFSRQPVGAGPFALAEWERGSHMRFLRNPGYWQEGKPLLDEIVVLTGIADAAPKYDALAGGKAQVALEPLGGNIARYRERPDRFDLLTTPETGGGVALAMNLARPPFDDRRIREALALVLDSQTFVDTVGYGDPGMVMTTIDRAGTPLCDPEIRLPGCDVPRAQALIDEAVAGAGGPVRFTLETFPNEGHVREANTIRQMIEDRLRQVEVEVKVGSAADLAGRWRTGEYQATNYAVRWSDSVLDLPANFASSSGQNIMGYSNPAVDEALEALAAASDSETVVALHRGVLRQVLRDLPVIWLSHKEAFHVVDTAALRDWKLFYSLRPMVEEAWLSAP